MSLFWDALKLGVPTLSAVAGYGYAKGRGMSNISSVAVSGASWFAGYIAYRVASRFATGGNGSLPNESLALPEDTTQPVQTSSADEVQSAVAGRAQVASLDKYRSPKRGKDGQPESSGDTLSSLSSSSLGSSGSNGSLGSA